MIIFVGVCYVHPFMHILTEQRLIAVTFMLAALENTNANFIRQPNTMTKSC